MLDKIFETIGGDVVSDLTSKAGITADQAKEVLPIAQDSIQSGLMEQVKGGNVSGILGMFNSGSGMGSNPIFGGIKQMFMSNIMSKMGLPGPVAGIVAGAGLEGMMGKIGGVLGGGGEVTQEGLMSNLGMGGDGGGLMDMAKNMAGDKLGGLGDAAKDKLGGMFN